MTAFNAIENLLLQKKEATIFKKGNKTQTFVFIFILTNNHSLKRKLCLFPCITCQTCFHALILFSILIIVS